MNRPIIDIVLLEDDGDDEDMESSPVINNIMSPTEEGTPTVPIGDTGNNNDTITVPIGDTKMLAPLRCLSKTKVTITTSPRGSYDSQLG